MNTSRLFPLLLLLPVACGTAPKDPAPVALPPDSAADQVLDTAAAYSAAIAEYINAVRESGSLVADTLYIGRHEQFPDIQLPAVIERVPVRVLTPAEAENLKEGEHFTYLNIFGWLAGDTAEFQVVTFRQDLGHRPDGQDDRHLHFHRERERWVLALDSLRS